MGCMRSDDSHSSAIQANWNTLQPSDDRLSTHSIADPNARWVDIDLLSETVALIVSGAMQAFIREKTQN